MPRERGLTSRESLTELVCSCKSVTGKYASNCTCIKKRVRRGPGGTVVGTRKASGRPFRVIHAELRRK